MNVMTCRSCGGDAGVGERVGRRDTCPRCGVDLHACRQCRFYDTTAYNECREPQAERVLDKIRSNFCDYFAPGDAAASTGSGASGGAVPGAGAAGATGARADLDRLFRRR